MPVFFYVLPLTRFTEKPAEESASNVTAEGKTSAQTDRETPFWRIKSAKWLWESRDVTGGAEELSLSLASSQSSIGLLFVFRFLTEALSSFSRFSLLTAPPRLSAFPSPIPFFLFLLVKSLPALSAPAVTFMSFFFLSSAVEQQADTRAHALRLEPDLRFPPDPAARRPDESAPGPGAAD